MGIRAAAVLSCVVLCGKWPQWVVGTSVQQLLPFNHYRGQQESSTDHLLHTDYITATSHSQTLCKQKQHYIFITSKYAYSTSLLYSSQKKKTHKESWIAWNDTCRSSESWMAQKWSNWCVCHMTMELRLPSFYMLYITMFKGTVSPKNEKSVITNSPSCRSKHVRPLFIFWTQILMKHRCFRWIQELSDPAQQHNWHVQGPECSKDIVRIVPVKSVVQL